MRSVIPGVPIGASSSSSSLYQLYATRQLPTINCTVNVKHAVFSPPWLRRFNRCTFACRWLLGPAYWIGFVLCAVAVFSPMPLGGWLAVICIPLELIPMAVALLVLRYDMVALLVRTYEFWYMTLTNLFVCVCIAFSFGDARWPVLVTTAVGFELALLVDANFRHTRAIVVGTVFGALLNMSYTVSSTFGYVHTPRNAKLLSCNDRTLYLDDAIINVLGTIFLLLLRNAYRKHVMTSRRGSSVDLISIMTAALSPEPAIVLLAARLAVVSALTVFLAYAAFSQRQLLRRLFTSFDFLFLSFQISMTHACVADIVQWTDPRALAVVASWLLTHWVLLLDAVLPTHKLTHLGFRRSIAGAVVVVFLAGQLLVVAVLSIAEEATVRRLRLRDRELFTLTLHRREKPVYVAPLLFGRTLATLSWSLRLLWRLWDCRADELLLLQGRVEFHSSP